MNISLFTIKTSAWNEENFNLVTDLTSEQIEAVIEPMVTEERLSYESGSEDIFYSNEDYYWALVEEYPNNLVQMYSEPEEITF